MNDDRIGKDSHRTLWPIAIAHNLAHPPPRIGSPCSATADWVTSLRHRSPAPSVVATVLPSPRADVLTLDAQSM